MISIVPMIGIPNHTYSCVIPLTGRNITLTFHMTFNEVAGFWFVDISTNDKILLASYPLIPAQDLLEQFQYMDIGHASILPKTAISDQFPNYETINSEWVLVWGDIDD